MKRKLKFSNIINIIVVIMVVGLFLYLCFSDNGLVDLIMRPDALNLFWIIMAALCQLINLTLEAYLVYRFTHHHEKSYTIKQSIKTAMVGQFFGAITPAAAGSQPMQIYAMSKQGVDTGVATSSVLQKILVYQTVIMIYSASAIIIFFDYFSKTIGYLEWNLAFWALVIQAVCIGSLILFSFNKRITHKLIGWIFNLLCKLKIIKNPEERLLRVETQLEIFHQSNKDLYKNWPLVIETYVVTFIQFTFSFLIPYCVYRSFNLSGASAINMICSQSFILLVSHFIPIPGEAGAVEAISFLFLFQFFGTETIKAGVIVARFFSYYLVIILSAPFTRIVKNKNKFIETEIGGK